MATTAITVQTKPAGYNTTLTTLTYTAADTTNGNHFVHAGGTCLVVARNTSTVTSYTITVTSVPDLLTGRTGSITTQSIGGSNQAAGNKIISVPYTGWADTSTGYVALSATNSAVEFAVIRV